MHQVVFLLLQLCIINSINGFVRHNTINIAWGFGNSQLKTLGRIEYWNAMNLNSIMEAGCNSANVGFSWPQIQPKKGVYNWTMVDSIVDDLLARKLTIYAYTGNTPDWALDPAIIKKYGPGIGWRFPPSKEHIGDFELFYKQLSTRYKKRVQYYEFWNEENGCSWINDGCSNGHMAYTYVPWLKRWYTAMKGIDKQLVLSIGGLDCNYKVPECWSYIEDIYSNGGGDYFDAVALHPYGKLTGEILHWSAVEGTRNLLVSHGDSHKPIWLNEYGWSTTDERQKAANVNSVFSTLYNNKSLEYITFTQYLLLTDLGSKHGFGLCDSNMSQLLLTPRLSYTAYQEAPK